MDYLIHIGQWQGYFVYGPTYGDVVNGQQVEFRLFIETLTDGQFTGRCIDWDGLAANGEVSAIKGFVNGDFISFIKYYPTFYIMDEWGNKYEDASRGYQVSYEGHFDHSSGCFTGIWEIESPDHDEVFAAGTWSLRGEE